MDENATDLGGDPWKPTTIWEIHNSQSYFLTLARTAANRTQCPAQVFRISRVLYMYAFGILLAIALLLNGVMFIVFVSKALRRYACSSYLSTLAIVDFLALCFYVPKGWLRVLVANLGWTNLSLGYDENIPVCKVVTFLSQFAKFMSAWCVVGLAYSRLSAVKDLVRLGEQQTPRSARVIVLYIACLAILLNGHMFFTWSVVQRPDADVTSCSPAMNSTELSMFLSLGTVACNSAIPTLATFVLCVYLIRGLHKEKHFLSRRLSHKVIARLKNGRQISKMVLSLCGATVLLGIPHTVAWVVVILQHVTRDYLTCHYLYSYAVRDITEVLYMLVYTCKLFVCMMSGLPMLGR